MCSPATSALAMPIASAVFPVMSTVLQTSSQNKAANRYNRSIERGYEHQMATMQDQRRQMGHQQRQEESEISQMARREAARLAVVAGESGASGGVLDRLMTESRMSKEGAIGQSRTNLQNALVQTDREAHAARIQMRNQGDPGSSWSGAGLQIAGKALDVYANSRLMKDPRHTPYPDQLLNKLTGGRNAK